MTHQVIIPFTGNSCFNRRQKQLGFFFLSIFFKMETFTTQRNSIGLIHEGYKFTKHATRTATISWKCRFSSCRAVIITNIEMDKVISSRNHHNHDPPTQRDKQLNDLRSTIKRKAEENPNTRPSEVICPEAEPLPHQREKIQDKRRKT